MSDDIRIDVLADAIKDLPKGEIKDALADDLKFAQDINGTQDPALKGIKRLVISGVRRELLAEERIKNAIDNHVKACPLSIMPIKEGKAGVIATYIELLKPYRWPLALIFFSPFSVEIASKIIAALK